MRTAQCDDPTAPRGVPKGLANRLPSSRQDSITITIRFSIYTPKSSIHIIYKTKDGTLSKRLHGDNHYHHQVHPGYKAHYYY